MVDGEMSRSRKSRHMTSLAPPISRHGHPQPSSHRSSRLDFGLLRSPCHSTIHSILLVIGMGSFAPGSSPRRERKSVTYGVNSDLVGCFVSLNFRECRVAQHRRRRPRLFCQSHEYALHIWHCRAQVPRSKEVFALAALEHDDLLTSVRYARCHVPDEPAQGDSVAPRARRVHGECANLASWCDCVRSGMSLNGSGSSLSLSCARAITNLTWALSFLHWTRAITGFRTVSYTALEQGRGRYRRTGTEECGRRRLRSCACPGLENRRTRGRDRP